MGSCIRRVARINNYKSENALCEKKKVCKWTNAKQNPPCILKEIYVQKIAGFV